MTDAKLSRVASVIDPFTVVINRGARHGIKTGMRFLVYGIGGEIHDPVSGDSLGCLELVRGTGRVTHVQDQMATLVSDMQRSPTKRIRRIQSPLYAIVGRETVEELEGDPGFNMFSDPSVGDYAKPV